MGLRPEHLLLHFASTRPYLSGEKELLVLDRGEGVHVFDVDGRRYIDGLSSLFCVQIGYSYGEEMAAAASEQLSRLCFNTNWATAHPPALALSERIVALAPEGISSVFFTNGGSESVETAWKLVRQYHVANGEPQRTKAIAREIAYHGVTLGALSFTGVARFKDQFGPPAVPTRHVSNTNSFRSELQGESLTASLLEELERAVLEEGPETVAMIIAEPIQNAGGCLVPPPGYWAGLRELCDRYGILLVADEVISGFGRVGEWFAVQRYGGLPDLLTVAKGLTSAYAPMGAVLVGSRVAGLLEEAGGPILHGITFGGHPLSAAIALRNIDIFEREGVLENVRAREPHLRRRLVEQVLSLPIVGDVRGDGFFFAAELVRDEHGGRFQPAEVQRLVRGILPDALHRVGLIARADDRGDPVLQIAPPLICDEQALDEIVERMAGALSIAAEEIGLNRLAAAPAR